MPTATSLASLEWFFVGGAYRETDAGSFMEGQMYVERYRPAEKRHDTPVVMIHGGMQTGSNFTATADGRPGWVFNFLDHGYEVYVVDQPERGRSGHRLRDGRPADQFRYTAERTAEYFTDPASAALWPQAAQHSQWPGSGQKGDPAFDRFFASQVGQLADRAEIERGARDGGAALLDAIGPAILLTHSQSGPFGWLIADARPDAVKAILAIEPNGPPFKDLAFPGASDWCGYGEDLARDWGITRLPMTFDPPIDSAAELAPVETPAAAPNLAPGLPPSRPPAKLVNLAGRPILIVTAEASYHAPYDHLTSAFLDWAGVPHEHVRLEDRGLMGNSHMVMLEQNSAQIAGLLMTWLSQQGF